MRGGVPSNGCYAASTRVSACGRVDPQSSATRQSGAWHCADVGHSGLLAINSVKWMRLQRQPLGSRGARLGALMECDSGPPALGPEHSGMATAPGECVEIGPSHTCKIAGSDCLGQMNMRRPKMPFAVYPPPASGGKLMRLPAGDRRWYSLQREPSTAGLGAQGAMHPGVSGRDPHFNRPSPDGLAVQTANPSQRYRTNQSGWRRSRSTRLTGALLLTGRCADLPGLGSSRHGSKSQDGEMPFALA